MAANAKRERPFVLQWRSAVFNSDEPASVKLVLLALAEYGDSEGRAIVVSHESLAELTNQSAKTSQRSIRSTEGRWFERDEVKLPGRDWKGYRYTLRLPESSDTKSARQRRRRGTESAHRGTTNGHSVRQQATLRAPGGDTKSHELGTTLGKREGGKATSFREWSDSTNGRELIRRNDQVFEFAEAAGIPDEFLRLAWSAFCKRFDKDPIPRLDWRETFRRAIREDWFKVWRVDQATGQYMLTTVGQQLQRVAEAKDEAA